MRQYCPKVILENFFEPCVLFLLMQKPSYGYELKAELDDKCSCNANIGNLYRCLARLEKSGYINKKTIKGDGGPKRLIYHLTADGKKWLAEWMEELETESARINKLITNYKKLL